MRIAILSPFYPFRGGMAQFSGRLFTELFRSNEVKAFNFTTLYPNFLFPGKTQFVGPDDSAQPLPNERVLNSINPFSYISTARKINNFEPDILIIPYWMSFLAPAFGIISRGINRRTKIIGLIHNAIPHEKKFFDVTFARFFFKKCHGFIVLSENVKEDLMKLVPKAKVLVSPHPIYDQYKSKIDKQTASAELGINPDKKNLLFFGLIREYKGLDILIEAMSFLDNTYQLIIAGESYENFQKYQALINKSPLKSNIKVLEQYIPDDMVTTLFSAADVLVLPYRSATQSGVVAVAYQLETPMIATDVGALGKTIKEAHTGIIVDKISPEAIAVGIKKYFQEKEKIEEYKANIEKEKQRLSWSTFARKIETFLSE